ncbi:MAG: TrkA family potassium uptake protein, partial [Oscillospiraceae bacterium]
MNILIVGCGKVGSRLSGVLSKQGHDVSVVSKSDEGFDLLPKSFNGFTTLGVPIDQDVLKKAGIESCDALIAVTTDDNVNIMVSELAKEIFKVPKVFVRIYDPKREDVFSDMGLRSVCPTNLTVAAICNALSDEKLSANLNYGTRTI